MNRNLVIVAAFGLLYGSLPVFAQEALPVPEPSPAAPVTEAVPVSPRPALVSPAFNDELSFLWNRGLNAGYVEYLPVLVLAQAGASDAQVPSSIRNNRYFVESVRLTNLAQQTFDEGDYDAAAQYSEEAIRYARLSDEYVQLQLKIKETDDAIAAARRRLDYAASVNAASRYPGEYSQAQAAYNEARTLRASENWDGAIAAAGRVLAALAYINSEPEKAPDGPPPLPSRYTVRAWAVSKDCLWNIAGRPWVYNDSRKWKVLYEANRQGMPEPDNPDLIHPGMVLSIPSIQGEIRDGLWDAAKNYPALR